MATSKVTQSVSLNSFLKAEAKKAKNKSLPQNSNGVKNSAADKKQSNNTAKNKNIDGAMKKTRDGESLAYANLDTSTAILEKLPSFVDAGMDIVTSNSFTFSESPLELLMKLLNVLGVTDEEIKNFIVNFLVVVLPEVEIGVKAALLSNIKSIVSCSSDPRIPLQLRKSTGEYYGTALKNKFKSYNGVPSMEHQRGILIDCDSIDPEGILSYSPFSEKGKNYYFNVLNDNASFDDDNTLVDYGTLDQNATTLNETSVSAQTMSKWELCRAEDKNAFLWFAIHCAKFSSPTLISISGSNVTIGNNKYIDRMANNNGKSSALMPMDLKLTSTKDGSSISVGNTIVNSGATDEIAVCIKTSIQESSNPLGSFTVTGNTFVPVSSDWNSADWYVTKSNYYTYNLGYKSYTKPTLDDYANKQKAICNIQFLRPTEYETTYVGGSTQKLLFTILPKPYVYLPYLDSGEPLWRWKKILFNAYGEPDPDGDFSLPTEKMINGRLYVHNLMSGDPKSDYIKLDVGKDEDDCALYINKKTGSYKLASSKDMAKTNGDYSKHLIRCYNGLTVYEFNYDFVMGMKLFDPKVVCAKLLNAVTNPTFDSTFRIGLNVEKDNTTYPYLGNTQAITEIVRKIIESEDTELANCFFSFSNTDIDNMLNVAEEKRYHQQPYLNDKNTTVDLSDVYEMLTNYPEEGTKQEQKTVLSNAIEAATAKVSSNRNIYATSDSKKLKINFATNMLSQLAATIIESILTPKVLLLIAVNKKIMGNGGEDFNTTALLNAMKGLVKAIVKEIMDLILKKMLDWVLDYIGPIVSQLAIEETKEQVSVYLDILKELLNIFRTAKSYVPRVNSAVQQLINKFSDKNNGTGLDYDLPTVLDNVNYADIIKTISDNDTPATNNNC